MSAIAAAAAIGCALGGIPLAALIAGRRRPLHVVTVHPLLAGPVVTECSQCGPGLVAHTTTREAKSWALLHHRADMVMEATA